MHQSFETPVPLPPPPPPPLPIGPWQGIGRAFTSDTPHVGSTVGGEFAGSHGLRIPYRGNKRGSHSQVICMTNQPTINQPFVTTIRYLHFRSFKPAYSIANLGGLYYLHSYLQSKK